MRFLFIALAFFSTTSLWAAQAAKASPKASAKAPVRATAKPAARATAARATVKRAAPATSRTAVRKAPARSSVRYARYRNGKRYRYSYVNYFRPVLSASISDLPEMVSPLGNLTETELQNSFYYRRPDGMVHYAIDIFRPIGEPLQAVVDGYVERIEPNPLGGKVVYIVDEEKRFRFYYAHLDRHAEGIYAGMPVKRGDIIGYVGDTGNAKGTNPHLHFQIANLAGAVVNPFPVLVDIVRRVDELPAISE